MKKTKVLRTLAILMITGAVAVAAYTAKAKNAKDATIYAGVYLDGVYVGGLTKDQAMEEYDKYIDGIDNLNLTFTTSVGSHSVTLDELGVSVSVEDAVDQH